MASVWQQMRGQPEQKLLGHMRVSEAQARLRGGWESWAKMPNRTVTEGADGYIQLRENGTVVGIMWCEYLSPPSAPEPGQPHRQRKGALR